MVRSLDMLNHGRRTHCWLPKILAVLLVLPPGLSAQAPQPPAINTATTNSLKVVALAGNQEMNDLEHKVMAPLVIQVLDQNDLPVEGADVIVRFPLTGPSALFPDQKNAGTFRTNADGQAGAAGWMANNQVGTFKVQVTATRGGEQGSVTVSMTNVTRITEADKTRQKKWWSTRWGKIAIVAGAAGVAAAVILATRGGSNSPKVVVVTGTPGSPTIGGPQ
jgi:hypothetical protein